MWTVQGNYKNRGWRNLSEHKFFLTAWLEMRKIANGQDCTGVLQIVRRFS